MPDNIVLTKPAAAALCRQFIGWQCRLRQLAARQDGARPSAGMRPRVTTAEGQVLAAGIVSLIVESEPETSNQLFSFQYRKTADPSERYDKMLEILQGHYFQEPARFAGLLTALFAPGSALVAELLDHRRVVLDFAQYTQGYRLPCAVARLPESHRFHQATVWHNRMFNPHLPAGVQVLLFTPDWPHAAEYRSDPELEG
jgi:hypothetical protein